MKKNKIEILFVIPNLIGGGAEKVFTDLLKHMDRNKFKISLAIGMKKGKFSNSVPTDVRIYELGTESSVKGIFYLLRLVWSIRPKIIFATLGSGFSAAMIRPFIPKETYIISRWESTMSAFLEETAKTSKLKAFVYKIMNILIYNLSHKVMSISMSVTNDAVKTLGIDDKKIITVYNPIDYDEINQLANEKISQPLHSPKLITVGSLKWAKGYDILLRSFALVLKEYPNASLSFVGDGYLSDELEEITQKLNIKNQVNFLGFQDNPYKYIKNADLFISSSRYEGFACVIVESLGIGTPVVATDCPSGNREIIIENFNGWLSPFDEDEKQRTVSLSKTIILGLKEFEHLNTNEIKTNIKENFDIKTISQKIGKVFVQIR